MSGGAIAGLVVGFITGAAFIVIVVCFILRRRQSRSFTATTISEVHGESVLGVVGGAGIASTGDRWAKEDGLRHEVSELDGWEEPKELPGSDSLRG
jgi:hypothetical protein